MSLNFMVRQEVTGSNLILEGDGVSVMIDYGFRGSESMRR